MDISLIKYNEAKKSLKQQKELQILMDEALNIGFAQKKFTFSKSQAESRFKGLIDKKLLQFNIRAKHYTFDFESPFIYIQAVKYAIKLLKRKPSNNPYDTIVFANDFLDEIKKPHTNVNWFTITFSSHIRFITLLECEGYWVNNFEELIQLLTTEQEHRSPEFDVKLYIDDVVPYYNFTTEQFWQLGNALSLVSERKKYLAQEIIIKVSEQSLKRATEFLELIKNVNNNSPFIVPIIIKLSCFDYKTALHESLNLLHNQQYEIQGVRCICRLVHRNTKELLYAYQTVMSHNSLVLDYTLELPVAFRIFMEHDFSNDAIKNGCIKEFQKLIEHDDKNVVSEAVSWISCITGFEEIRMDFLFSLVKRDISIQFESYFRNFNSPSYLFRFVKGYYLALQLQANIRKFKQAFDAFESKHPDEFSMCLTEVISNDIGVIRKIGIDLISSKNSGSYSLQAIDLSEERQLIVIDTLLSVPFQVEKTLPFALQLRNSTFPNVRESFTYHLTRLVFAYENVIIEILSANLNMKIAADSDLFSKVNKVWIDYKKVIETKRGLLELNPFINQRKYAELYYREEREFNAEKMEEARQNSTMLKTGLAKDISVIRGCAFTTEGNPRISKLGKFEQVAYIDKRYYMNPSVYEATYSSHILLKNYKTE